MRRLLLLVLLLATTAGCREPVLSARSEAEANDALEVLIRAGLDARKAAGRKGFDVTVPADRMEEALSTLSASGLPREAPPGLAELFGEPGLVPTGLEEQVRYHRALEGELARTLGAVEGVAGARVHLALPFAGRRRPGDAPPAPVKAGVLVHALPGRATSLRLRTDELQRLVAGAVAGLAPEDVSVVVTEPPPPRRRPRRAGRRLGLRHALLAGGGATVACGVGLTALVVVRRRRRAPMEEA